jgi:hypothetical protein
MELQTRTFANLLESSSKSSASWSTNCQKSGPATHGAITESYAGQSPTGLI